MSNAVLYCTPSYKHWYPQAATRTLANNASQNKPTQQGRSQAHSHLQACWSQGSPLTVHSELPSCTHSSQPRYAGSNHHAPPPALAHLRWCHLAKRQAGLKARALPHTRPTVRSSMANCSAGLSKALTLRHKPRRTNTTKQSTRV